VESTPDLVAAADRNLIGSFRKLAGHVEGGAVRERDGVFAFRTGVPIALFKGCIVDRPSSVEQVRDALDWLGPDLPYEWWIREEMLEQFAGVVSDRGLESHDWLTPQMVLTPRMTIPGPGPGVSTQVVDDDASLERFIGVFAAGGGDDTITRRVFPPAFMNDPDVACITATLHGRPAGTSVAIRTGNVAGVYAVGTLRDARRRGVGTAATWAAVAAGRAMGAETIVLQSSAMGFPVYEAMGFRTVVRYAIHARR
jgi:GNAT superfamily N-acetyltransferase